MYVIGNLLVGAALVLHKVLELYSIVVFIAVLVSWVSPDPFNPVVQVLRALTEPVFRAIRRYLPFVVVGPVDLSPVVVWLLILFIQWAILPSVATFGKSLQ